MPLNQHLRKLWMDDGYPEGTGSAAVTPPPSEGYRRVYHLTSAEYAISNIVFSRLKVARFSQLNDPFELLSPKSGDKKTRAMIEEFREKFDEENGLLCFSADWTDPVLWSHYGARHRGVCLGFNVKEEILREVEYYEKRLTLPDIEGYVIPHARLGRLVLCTKFESWRYEQERRVLVPLTSAFKEGSLHFVPFDDELELAEVILGPLCSLSVKRVRKVIEKHHTGVVTILSRLAYKSFRIVPDARTVPRVQVGQDQRKSQRESSPR